jgi:hypothetical protein
MIGTVVTENFKFQFKELGDADIFLKYFTIMFKNADLNSFPIRKIEHNAKTLDQNCEVVLTSDRNHNYDPNRLSNRISLDKNFILNKTENARDLNDLLADFDGLDGITQIGDALINLLNSLLELVAQIVCCLTKALNSNCGTTVAVNGHDGVDDFFAELAILLKLLLNVVRTLLNCLSNILSENRIFNSLFEPSINFVSNSLKIFLKDLERLDAEINENKLSVIKLQDALLNMQEFTEYFPLLMKATSTFMSSGARVIDSSLKISVLSLY